jgi:sodium-dependent dicarboxylate transporter 2/3/5
MVGWLLSMRRAVSIQFEKNCSLNTENRTLRRKEKDETMVDETSAPSRSLAQKTGLYLGTGLFLVVILFFDLEPGKPIVTRMAAVAVLMAVWWITDTIPLFATALLPMILYPLLGILSTKATAPIYINSTIFLFLGGFIIALTMEHWNLHKRIALFIIRIIGGGPSRIVLGFMVAAAFLSMWISNTATAIMMLPIGMAIISKMEAEFGVEETHKLTLGLMLGIAYACSVGGMATLVGTPPNLAFARIFSITFPAAKPIAFGTWFIMALPLSGVLVAVIWGILTKILYRVPAHVTIDKSIVDKEYKDLGPMSFEERAVLLIFSLTAVLWVFRKDLILGFVSIPGWSNLIPYPKLIDDGTVALVMAMLVFFIPTRSAGADSPTLMAGEKIIDNLPWGIVILFGGGFALAKGFQSTGLSTLIGQNFAGIGQLHPIVMVLIICTVMTFLTEVTSNTATTQMILPILASVAVDIKIDPLLLMIPATLAASCAFMMPIATPPNAIVFGSGRIKIAEMAKTGLIINLIGVILITLLYFVGPAIFDIDINVFPEWAQQMAAGSK